MADQAKFIKALSSRIEKLRRERKLSYQNLADDCNMEKMRIYDICTKPTDVKASTLAKIAKGLDMTVSELTDFKY